METIEKYLSEKGAKKAHIIYDSVYHNDVVNLIKKHVNQALIEAVKKAKVKEIIAYNEDTETGTKKWIVDKDSILNSYPETNII